MSDLTDFLLARLAEDHAWAKRQERVAIRTHHVGRHGPHTPDHYSRVLADVEAKRRIVELHRQAVWHQPAGMVIASLGRRLVEEGDHLGGCEICAGDDSEANFPCATLSALALPYADHPDYHPEWRP